MKGNKIPAMKGADVCKKLVKAFKKSGIDFEITRRNRLVFHTPGGKHSISIGKQVIQSGQIREIVDKTGIDITEIL